ncbi:MAG: 4Fe-4S binding protein [Gammaproteobacteria bacterium]|nr:4Fe-4S binding protein [Gammaproteobacteria bacterium]
MMMVHPGLPSVWAAALCVFMLALSAYILLANTVSGRPAKTISLANIPVLGAFVRALTGTPVILLFLKITVVCLFVLVIAAGLSGSQIPERNIATVLTWNIWWAGLIISVFFLGSAWCAICPWDAIATWLVRRRLWRRAHPNNSLNLRVSRRLRSVWPALVLFIVLTWFELGVGVTSSPYMTALLALAMVLMATASLAVFEGKAFCRYFCPVGRTIGFYSQLAPVELRPVNTDICAGCKTLECYYGSETVDPCPTHLVMGRLKQNTYCTSCGNCARSCPDNNVAWRLRAPSREAIEDARPHWDEAWFMLGLLALTEFHGISMAPFFEAWLLSLAALVNDSGKLLWSFSILLLSGMLAVVLAYAFFVRLTQKICPGRSEFKKLFSGFVFVSLPLAFSYHLAHNLSHLFRESSGFGALLLNPFGLGAQPLSMMEKHSRHQDILFSQDFLFASQAALLAFGFWISLKVIQHRGYVLAGAAGLRLSPMIMFAITITGLHVWLLMQPMMMRF